MVRAPYHAKRPTDRIMLITIELMVKLEKSCCFYNFIKNCIVYETEDYLIAVRQNPVMKEESTYNAFIVDYINIYTNKNVRLFEI